MEKFIMNENKSYATGVATTKIPTHQDYNCNVNYAGKWLVNFNEKKKYKHLCGRMVKNTDGEKYFLEFNFIISFVEVPEIDQNYPCFASPLDPNQPTEKFMFEFKTLFYEFVKLERKYFDYLKFLNEKKEEKKNQKEFERFDPR